jgi:CDP-glucose 4,6-dehydratase
MNPIFWQGKRVFLTGHTGFKGSWLSLWLQSLGAEVTGYALAPLTTPNLFDRATVAGGMHSVFGDVRDLIALQQAMKAAKPDIVIHMAAQSLVRYGYQNPVETFATNVMGSVNLLESVRHTPSVRAVVNVTSDKCYKSKSIDRAFTEEDPMGGIDPYSSSKGCAELVSSAYRNSFFSPKTYAQHGVAIATARAGNVIGGGDWSIDRLIPDILAAFSQGREVAIRFPNAVRPWQHVLEALSGYLVLTERLFDLGPSFAGAWNFGPDGKDNRTVAWVVEQMAALWGKDARWRIDDNQHPHEAQHLSLDIAKAAQQLDWQPAMNLTTALPLTMDWARLETTGQSMREVTLSQIQAYQASRMG